MTLRVSARPTEQRPRKIRPIEFGEAFMGCASSPRAQLPWGDPVPCRIDDRALRKPPVGRDRCREVLLPYLAELGVMNVQQPCCVSHGEAVVELEFGIVSFAKVHLLQPIARRG